MPVLRVDHGWAIRAFQRLRDETHRAKPNEEDRAAIVDALRKKTRDREHAEAAIGYMLDPIEMSDRGTKSMRARGYSGVGSVLAAIAATAPNAWASEQLDYRDAILESFPHALLALEAVPLAAGCETCATLWAELGVPHDDPLRDHIHPLDVSPLWEEPSPLISEAGGRAAWLMAFGWARRHTPDGRRVEDYHPIRDRDPARFDRAVAEIRMRPASVELVRSLVATMTAKLTQVRSAERSIKDQVGAARRAVAQTFRPPTGQTPEPVARQTDHAPDGIF